MPRRADGAEGRMTMDEFLKRIIEYFGETKQETVCIEEMAELTQQLCKFTIDHPNKSREKLVEEYVDVLIMLNQMKIIFNITDEEVENGKIFKLARLQRFIESRRTLHAPDPLRSGGLCICGKPINHQGVCAPEPAGR